ncbi:methyltransferase domain-containing protein [Embleya sp. NPDC001921]
MEPASIADLLVSMDRMPAGWERAFRDVDRAHFAPDRVWPFTYDGQQHAVDRALDPVAWEEAVRGNTALVTQWDDGRHVGPAPGLVASSSASMPSAVADMLLDLDVHGGERVLDIGTGTGYTAALLAARGCAVTTVEVDEHLAEQARKNLARAGYPDVTVITGDGAHGHPAGAPYERIHVTAGVRRIPAAWLEQARPGAILLLPWGTDYSPHDAALRLVVEGPGRASGPFTMALSFMKLRAQRAAPVAIDVPEGWPDVARAGGTELSLADVVGGPYDPVAFVIGLRVPGCVPVLVPGERAGDGTLWLTGGGAVASVAAAGFARGRRPNVLQAGPRSLWDEVEDAYRWWDRVGRPEVFDFGLTVTADAGEVHQVPWYASPDHEIPGI